MNRDEGLKKLAERNNGILRTRTVVDAGISKYALAKFVRRNSFERVLHGVYCSPDSWQDALYLLQLRCPQTIFSHETALFLLDMTDGEPLKYTVTAKTGYNPTHLTTGGVKVYTVNRELFQLGTMNVPTPFGHTVTIYGPERTLCDMIRSRNSVEIQSFRDALNRYVRRRDKNLHILMEYAKLFHIDKRLNQYMEVLL